MSEAKVPSPSRNSFKRRCDYQRTLSRTAKELVGTSASVSRAITKARRGNRCWRLWLTGRAFVRSAFKPKQGENKMTKLLVVAALAATCMAIPAYAATDAECRAMWTKADVNKDGVLSDAESMRYAAAMRVHEKPTASSTRRPSCNPARTASTPCKRPTPARR
jgi:hypothetical protein